MCGEVRRLSGEVPARQQVAQGRRRPDVDGVAGGDVAAVGEGGGEGVQGGGREQNQEKFLKLRHPRWLLHRATGQGRVSEGSRCQVAGPRAVLKFALDFTRLANWTFRRCY